MTRCCTSRAPLLTSPVCAASLVVGSQAILGAYHETELPARSIASTEVDVVVLDDPTGTAGTTVDAAIGWTIDHPNPPT